MNVSLLTIILLYPIIVKHSNLNILLILLKKNNFINIRKNSFESVVFYVDNKNKKQNDMNKKDQNKKDQNKNENKSDNKADR